ncbi:hypothetical protein GCM10010384_59530 [Streptomyces djakartensis]|uniref:Uncharacterized protein n=1 Tax=Streptomyces djakartensis TaxID=68193 RepID=A0ABQ3ADT1_9ACTN|nr:hypothetical protein GCM10010384_59530 [Streptomyces djakartensis]
MVSAVPATVTAVLAKAMFLCPDRLPADRTLSILFRFYALALATLCLRFIIRGDLAISRAVECESSPRKRNGQAAASTGNWIWAYL